MLLEDALVVEDEGSTCGDAGLGTTMAAKVGERGTTTPLSGDAGAGVFEAVCGALVCGALVALAPAAANISATQAALSKFIARQRRSKQMSQRVSLREEPSCEHHISTMYFEPSG